MAFGPISPGTRQAVMPDSSGVVQNDPIAPIRAAIAGRYEIIREVGQGAFATVYLARDLRHDRDVAFKILNADPNSETGELRFLREIRVLAKLQHPNILPLIDSGHAEAMLYYVMPFISGENLRQRMNRERQLPLEAAVAITREAADALACAHDHGIIHRDIKPENILLSGGHPVIADFGIARAIDLAGVRQLTRTGIGSPGTPAYMSPEQLMADKDIDARTDIYSLGCVFYEMLTGKPPFAGKDGLVRRFTEAPPRPAFLRVGLPSSIDGVVTKALAREPADRYATAAEFTDALAGADLSAIIPAPAPAPVASAESTVAMPVQRPRTQETSPAREKAPVAELEETRWRPTGRPMISRSQLRLLAGGIALGIVAALAFAWPSLRRSAPNNAPVRIWEIVLPDSAPLAFVGVASLGIGRPSLALSPDGNTIVYVARRGSATLLYARFLDKLGAVQLAGTDGAFYPFFSPDGRWLAFFADTYLKKVSIPDGQVVTVARVNQPMGGVWTENGQILVADGQGSRPGWIPESGGRFTPIQLEGEGSHQWRYPQLSPDGEWAVHTDWDGALSLSSVKSGRAYVITTAGVLRRDSTDVSNLIFGTSPAFVSTGHIVYLSGVGGVLMALPFDAARRKVLGPPVPILGGIRQEAEAGAGQFAIARDGTLLYAPGSDAGRSVLVTLNTERGKLDTLPFSGADYNGFEVSPDGKKLLIRVQSASGRPELWVFDFDKGSQTRIPTDGIPLDIPRWWPDSKQIVYSEFTREGGLTAPVVRLRLDGVTRRDTIVKAAKSAVPAPDGHHLAVTGWDDHPGTWLVPVDAPSEKPVQLVSEPVYFTSFSPDGKWIVYAAPDPLEIFASSVVHPTERYKISTAGGEEPLWSPRGDRIVYRNGTQWFAVDVSTANGFKAGKARLLFEGPYLNAPGWSHSFFPDGQRQLLLLGPQEQTSNRLVAVTNWFAELQRLAPPGKN